MVAVGETVILEGDGEMASADNAFTVRENNVAHSASSKYKLESTSWAVATGQLKALTVAVFLLLVDRFRFQCR